MGRLDTCYAPVRRSPSIKASFDNAAPRLACVKPVASVHPEPGSNSSSLKYHSWLHLSSYTCLIRKESEPVLLSLSFTDIDGSLRVRLPAERQLSSRSASNVSLSSCTTISVYVNLSKNLLRERSALEPYPYLRYG